jgi:hypothetical protein
MALTKTKWVWFISLLSLVIGSNILLYQLDSMQPLSTEVALGSLFDFLITIPVITYFFIIRKRYSLKYLLPVMMVGYGAALWIIPNGYMESYSFIKYVLFASEAAFILLELYIGFKLLTKMPAIIKFYRSNTVEIPTFPYRLEQAFTRHLKPNRFLGIIFSEITMFYYSLFSWRKKPLHEGLVFTSHKKTSAIAVYVMLIHALILESVGFHFLLHSWNEIVAIIALVLNLYTLLIFLAEIQAIRLAPFIITNQQLYLQVGIMKQLIVPLEEIKSLHYYEGPEKLSKEEEKIVFDACMPDFIREKPAIEIEFFSPQESKMMYGFKKKVTKVHLRPDEPQLFFETLKTKITMFRGE